MTREWAFHRRINQLCDSGEGIYISDRNLWYHTHLKYYAPISRNLFRAILDNLLFFWDVIEIWMQEIQPVKISYANRTSALHATPYTEPTSHWESLHNMLYINMQEIILPLSCLVLLNSRIRLSRMEYFLKIEVNEYLPHFNAFTIKRCDSQFSRGTQHQLDGMSIYADPSIKWLNNRTQI